VCLKLIASAGIVAVYYEHEYESKSPERDKFWRRAVEEARLKTFEKLTISRETYDYILSDITDITSRRRWEATNFLPEE